MASENAYRKAPHSMLLQPGEGCLGLAKGVPGILNSAVFTGGQEQLAKGIWYRRIPETPQVS